MPSKFLEKQHSPIYKLLDFIGYSNIYIALCAASLTALSQKLFLHHLSFPFIGMTFSATFLLYNLQRMYLSFFETKPYTFKNWQHKHKYIKIVLMVISCAGLYPALEISKENIVVYFISFLLGVFYFLPFSNLRAIPVIKSFTVGAVWVLVCIVAPLEESVWSADKIYFCVTQLFFISALCVLFNIRDMEEDRRNNAYSVPVIFGIQKTKIFNYFILFFYLLLAPCVQFSYNYFIICFIVFFVTCLFTYKASLQNHPFYYTFGVDGVILLQSLLGFLFLR